MVDFSEIRASAQVSLFNDAQILLGRDESAFVKKFASIEKGAVRLAKIQEELSAMYGTATVSVSPGIDDEEGNPGADTYEWATEKKSDAPKAGRAPTTTLNLAGVISVLVDANPKRSGSRAAVTFDLYSDGQTAEEFCGAMKAAGYTRKLALATLHWDVAHEFISIA